MLHIIIVTCVTYHYCNMLTLNTKWSTMSLYSMGHNQHNHSATSQILTLTAVLLKQVLAPPASWWHSTISISNTCLLFTRQGAIHRPIQWTWKEYSTQHQSLSALLPWYETVIAYLKWNMLSLLWCHTSNSDRSNVITVMYIWYGTQRYAITYNKYDNFLTICPCIILWIVQFRRNHSLALESN